MMKVKYMYKKPTEMPIESVKFLSTGGSEVLIEDINEEIEITFIDSPRMLSLRTFNKPDLADLITLLQRFYKQMPEVE